ncbi:MAG: HD domain-containing protein [Prevotellaceae bacterium]|jgi:HD superfamily phosphohydrolase|nr:HD domain-containing protein [Prevotellaceae bacterium]
MIPKKKIVNDPIHGFIDIPAGIIYDLLEHPWMQRLRNIKQLGLSHLVYPGACHSRLGHALGAMHLMKEAIASLRAKGHDITHDETEAALCAILLHDVGHGPFSHTLESAIVEKVHHEQLSLLFMKHLNEQFGGRLDKAIAIFEGKYKKRFLHQLVSGQLDVDRLDYLLRDSFFSGVAEGMVGVERILKMLDVVDDELVVEAKGIYSVEKFLISRRLMYWQVYLHKTVIAADRLLLEILSRARTLMHAGVQVFASPALAYFLKESPALHDFESGEALRLFALLDDSDIDCAIKVWMQHEDELLPDLSRMLVHRRLPKVELSDRPFEESELKKGGTMMWQGEISNKGYESRSEKIKIRMHGGVLCDIYDVSDMLNSQAFSKVTKKYYLCYPGK